ncbi:hypothetical protein ACFL47_08565 [Candidatus Latescibacterota bacterium]
MLNRSLLPVSVSMILKVGLFLCFTGGCGDSSVDSDGDSEPDEANPYYTGPVGVVDGGHSDNYVIEGIVVDDNNTALGEDVMVLFFDWRGDDTTLKVWTTDDGKFRFEGLQSWKDIYSEYDLAVEVVHMKGTYERALFWPLVKNKSYQDSTYIEMNMDIFKIVPGTMLKGHIYPSSPFGSPIWLVSLNREYYRQGPAFSASSGEVNGKSNFYYNHETGEFHIQNCLAGGSYRIHINALSSRTDLKDITGEKITIPPGETVKESWNLTDYGVTVNN